MLLVNPSTLLDVFHFLTHESSINLSKPLNQAAFAFEQDVHRLRIAQVLDKGCIGEDRFKAFRQGGGATSFTSLTFLFSKKLLHSIVGALWLDPLFAMRGLHFNGIDEEFIPIFVNLRFHQDAKYIRP